MNKVFSLAITATTILFVSFLSCSHKKVTAPTENKTSYADPVVGLNLGNLAPEIVQNDINGKAIKLSSLRGQIVLIDFWASWCGPCRFENPAVVRAYTQYKDKKFAGAKGMTVFSVSLDTNKDAWMKAIQKDNLTWSSHVSDLQGWSNAAAGLYGVQGIPANFLINEKGIIINKNLRGDDLIAALEQLVVK